uniref:Uncharacterized protein n=1 Tax=Glossina pallidipes TaxID=7398 RepID=A0A1B0ACN3_GLOPL
MKSFVDRVTENDDDKAAVAVDVFIELSASMSSKLAEGISFCSTDEGASFSLAVAVAAELFSFSLTTVAVAAAATAEDATEAPAPSIASFVVRETAFAAVGNSFDA